MIRTISNHQHGDYNNNSFKVGNDVLEDKDDFYEFGSILAPYTDSNSTIVLQSCHSDSGENMAKSKNNMKMVGDASGANVIAPMTWGRGSKSLFNGESGAAGGVPTAYLCTYNSKGAANRSNALNFKKYLMYNQKNHITRFSTSRNTRFNRNGTFIF